jgi:hypothetical protein
LGVLVFGIVAGIVCVVMWVQSFAGDDDWAARGRNVPASVIGARSDPRGAGTRMLTVQYETAPGSTVRLETAVSASTYNRYARASGDAPLPATVVLEDNGSGRWKLADEVSSRSKTPAGLPPIAVLLLGLVFFGMAAASGVFIYRNRHAGVLAMLSPGFEPRLGPGPAPGGPGPRVVMPPRPMPPGPGQDYSPPPGPNQGFPPPPPGFPRI